MRICFLVFFSFSLFSLEYVSKDFVNLHQAESSLSQPLKILQCSSPVKVLTNLGKWKKVKKGSLIGYIESSYLSKKRTSCFSNNYRRFYDHLELSGTDQYYKALLRDRVMKGRSRVQ